MPQIYLFANLTLRGNPIVEVRYLHATRETRKEADALCKDLNEQLLNARYHVVEDDE
jgi:hypothetical protein